MISLSEQVQEIIKEHEKYFKENLKYTLENEKLPVLMQDLPGLALLGKIALQCEPSIPKIKTNEDIYLTILAILFKYSLMDLTNLDYGYLLDNEKFFKKLENVLIFLLDYHLESSRYNRKRLKNSKLKDFVGLIQKYIDNTYNEDKFYNSLGSAYSDICITFQELDQLKTYINLLEEN
jgi:hypothetical protein